MIWAIHRVGSSSSQSPHKYYCPMLVCSLDEPNICKTNVQLEDLTRGLHSKCMRWQPDMQIASNLRLRHLLGEACLSRVWVSHVTCGPYYEIFAWVLFAVPLMGNVAKMFHPNYSQIKTVTLKDSNWWHQWAPIRRVYGADPMPTGGSQNFAIGTVFLWFVLLRRLLKYTTA